MIGSMVGETRQERRFEASSKLVGPCYPGWYAAISSAPWPMPVAGWDRWQRVLLRALGKLFAASSYLALVAPGDRHQSANESEVRHRRAGSMLTLSRPFAWKDLATEAEAAIAGTFGTLAPGEADERLVGEWTDDHMPVRCSWTRLSP